MVKRVRTGRGDKSVNNGVDRISELPDHIRHDILSRLDIQTAVQTSVLSRDWRHQWIWRSCLKFNRYSLPHDVLIQDLELVCSAGEEWQREIFGKKEAFFNCLDQTLQRRASRSSSCVLQKLSVYVPAFNRDRVSHVNLWVACAMECGVKKLYLDYHSQLATDMYRLPESVLTACSLTSLKLFNCDIKLKNLSMINLTSLQKMSLFMVEVDDQTIVRMIASCHALKKLSLVYCWGFRKLEISSVGQLEEVKVAHIDGIEKFTIDAINLQVCTLRGFSLAGQEVHITSCKNLRHLTLNEVYICGDQLSSFIGKLQFLSRLCLIKCGYLRGLKVFVPSLKHLNVEYCNDLSKAEINAPALESLVLCANDMLQLSMIVPSLTSAVITLSYNITDALWHSRLIKFLEEFNHSHQSVTLTLSINQNMILIHESLRQSFSPPLFNVTDIKIQLYYREEAYYAAEIVDSVLWLSPHPESITIFWTLSDYKEVKFRFTYKEEIDIEADCSCCSCIPIKCWRHSLKEVKIDNLPDVVDVAKLKSLFHTSETLEKI